ncbi:olfactory receptor 14A16-like [Paroedura picta]|uniref:olfactory receptor 14A16-like n=1 Tax=Paroedura picta TaxID=143630 RepID=UPI004057A00F
MSNLTSPSEFLLLEFSDIRELQILHFFVFLAIYLTAVTGNLLIIIAVAFDHHLHTPMYFFLMNLALLDLGTVSVLIPKTIANSLLNTRYPACVGQVFFYFFFGGSDFAILTIMAHDRYVAICNPLQYETIMHRRACIEMAASAWIAGTFVGLSHSGGTFAITFCSNMIDQFFCEVPQILKLSCSDMYLVEIGIIIFGCLLGLGCFVFIIASYMQIFVAVLKIPSVHSQKKALSTCLPHLTVVSLFIVSGIFAYVRPQSHTSAEQNVLFAIIYGILPPLLNPFIYSMRNKEIKSALLKLSDLGYVLSSRDCVECFEAFQEFLTVVRAGSMFSWAKSDSSFLSKDKQDVMRITKPTWNHRICPPSLSFFCLVFCVYLGICHEEPVFATSADTDTGDLKMKRNDLALCFFQGNQSFTVLDNQLSGHNLYMWIVYEFRKLQFNMRRLSYWTGVERSCAYGK